MSPQMLNFKIDGGAGPQIFGKRVNILKMKLD